MKRLAKRGARPPVPVKETPVYFAPVSDDLAVRLAYAIYVQRPPLPEAERALLQEAHDEIVKIRKDRDSLGAKYAARERFVVRVLTELCGKKVGYSGGAIQSSEVDRAIEDSIEEIDAKNRAR